MERINILLKSQINFKNIYSITASRILELQNHDNILD